MASHQPFLNYFVSLSRVFIVTNTALASTVALKGRKHLLITDMNCGFSIYYNIKSIKLYKIQRQNVAVFSLSCQSCMCFALGNLSDLPLLYLNLTEN